MEDQKMTMRRATFVALFGIATLAISVGMSLAAETGTRVSGPGSAYANVTAPALREMLERKDFLLVNVHVPYEGEIAATDMFIPFNEIGQQIGRLPSQKDAKIVLYCQSGRMSDIAAQTLGRLGYTNLWKLEGGMVDWNAKGYPLIQQGRR
jgi:rhodanese-related sulfurtransferase